ncbi:hypothetical protein GLV98_02290 [Halobacillus litoralis]|uniref:Uncharacterized protein n=1 Tax=Halobacillus litoralis TaxID=45668 RepID=A0A845DZ32_9BACI|nr:hypothetical protein [Halobacillus litoralis]MYL48290.1 hypothetical protein [Halobacillus litoralis]
MLRKPFHARCDDRTRLSSLHPVAGDAGDWFPRDILEQFSLSAVGFDFFVNWSNYKLSDEYWVKRILSEEELSNVNDEILEGLIYACDSKEFVEDLARIPQGSVKYLIFRESTDWNNLDEGDFPILKVNINSEGRVDGFDRLNIYQLMEQIQFLSGGPVHVGGKGLIYSTSRLECYLSRTDSAWPGDVDLVLLDKEKNPFAIIEFKKHTLTEDIENHKFERYYSNGKDTRKYNRLAILKENMGNDIPLYILYYPTKEKFDYVLFEEATGGYGSLEAGNCYGLDLPTNKSEQTQFISNIVDIIKKEQYI